ncbi:transcriptional regulator, TetR family [Microbacterium sp. cf046]|uniref:TetR/AcrR family transcriptional regulator n=1 Tax=Microbacterium sp. cf046 TaxID=1761803 RepID=UPI0008F11140|nr:TetR family transcriptional regulator [Microbacterium sp. cf046]SFR91913.1 transcriptional regulator, TetR family [Microbacterium sp. cf046]
MTTTSPARSAAPRRGRGVAAGLTKARVVAAAERIIDDRGFDALSLRSVAAELGVSPAAIYNHVKDRSELVDAIADDFVAREMLADLPQGGDPVEFVREAARRIHRAGCRHPELLLAIVGHRPEVERTSQHLFGELIIENLLAAGASAQQAQLIYRAIISLATGAAVGYRNISRPSETTLAERKERQRAASDHPEAAQILHDMPELGDEAGYERQIDLALGALAWEDR